MKDPAFLFYSSDFLTGTMLMTDEQVGKYIRLLYLQHQKGHLLKEHMINICKSCDKDIFDKFRIDENGLYYNERLRIEIEKRSKYCESRRANRISANKDNHMSEHMSTHMLVHMENENENENEYTIFEKNVLNEWNILCNEYPILNKIIKISGSRRKHLKQRYAEKTFIITDIIKALKEQPKIINGLKYKEGGEWRVSFDWIIANDNNYIKILERRYKGDDANAMPSFIRTK